MGEAKRRGSKEIRIGEALHRQFQAQIEAAHRKEIYEMQQREREAAMTQEERDKRERARKAMVSLSAIMGISQAMRTYKPEPRSSMHVGGKYNWKGQPERLIYIGHNYSGNGYWHQFAKVESPEVIWCEVLTSDLDKIELTVD